MIAAFDAPSDPILAQPALLNQVYQLRKKAAHLGGHEARNCQELAYGIHIGLNDLTEETPHKSRAICPNDRIQTSSLWAENLAETVSAVLPYQMMIVFPRYLPFYPPSTNLPNSRKGKGL